MTQPSVALLCGSMNPPGLHHRAMAAAVAECMDKVIVVPNGPRPDKTSTDNLEPVHRAAMTDLTFRDLAKVRVELFDLEETVFTRTWALEERFRSEGQIWHVLPSPVLVGGRDGQTSIQQKWSRGQELWKNSRWLICHPPGAPPAREDLPPHHRLVESALVGSSETIRERAFKGQSIAEVVVPSVADYIRRHGLYSGARMRRLSRFPLDLSRPLLLWDERNPRAHELATLFLDRYPNAQNEEHPSLVVVLGGDGTMLHAIRAHWRKRVPFYGLNLGHLGFLLNQLGADPFQFPAEAVSHHLPLLRVETEHEEGHWSSSLAFNDAWVEREAGQTAWIEVRVNDVIRLERVVCDGVLVSTAAGSTSYARAMGVAPLLVDTPLLILTGSNVMTPNWKLAHLPLDTSVELRSLNPEKRPLRGFVDGAPCGRVRSMRIRASRLAAAELAFAPDHDMTVKLARIQFPT